MKAGVAKMEWQPRKMGPKSRQQRGKKTARVHHREITFFNSLSHISWSVGLVHSFAKVCFWEFALVEFLGVATCSTFIPNRPPPQLAQVNSSPSWKPRGLSKAQKHRNLQSLAVLVSPLHFVSLPAFSCSGIRFSDPVIVSLSFSISN
jgi:hypothetical protein